MEDLVMQESIRHFYASKKVFVTGHTGFKGSWFISYLHLLGAEIKGYSLPQENESLYNTISPQLRFESIIADIRDKEKLKTELLNFQPDFIFHFAAQPLVRKSYKIPAETFEINALGTANLLESVIDLRNKCTIILVTTDKVYENKETDIYYKETDTLGGYDPYSASKACTEIIANSFRNSFFNISMYNVHKKTITTVRAGNVIGGGDYNKDRIIPDIIRALSSSQQIHVRNPDAVRPWQHVLEPLNGYLMLAAFLNHNPENFSGAYNFGPEINDHLSVKQLTEIATARWGNGTWVNAQDETQPHEAGLLKLDISKAKDQLGWKPKLNSKEATEWTIDWYKQPYNKRFNYTLQQIKSYQER